MPVDRTAAPRLARMACAFVLAGLAALLAGCASGRLDPGGAGLSEKDARLAGALALYSQGILLENSTAGDTNENRRAAEAAFRQSLTLDPGGRRPMEALVSGLVESERYREALEALETFLEHHPEDIEMRAEAARMAESADLPAVAARHCAAILRQVPDEREIALALVRLLFQSTNDVAAIRAMREQRIRFKDDKSAALPLGWAVHFTYQDLQPKRALACLEVAQENFTNRNARADIMALQAENRLHMGQTNRAARLLVKAHHLNPDSIPVIQRLGSLWTERPKAIKTLEARARRETCPPTSLLTLAALHQARDESAQAASALERAAESYRHANRPPDVAFHLWLAALYDTARQPLKVERVLTEALTNHPDAHVAKNFLAYSLALRAEQLDRAERLVNEALSDQPGNAAYLDTKGWVLFKQGRLYEALQLLLKSAEMERDEPEILDHLATVLERLGRHGEAEMTRARIKELGGWTPADEPAALTPGP